LGLFLHAGALEGGRDEGVKLGYSSHYGCFHNGHRAIDHCRADSTAATK